MSGNGWEALSDVREWSGDHPVRLGDPPGCPEVIGKPFRISGSSREALLNVRERSGDPPGHLG